MDTLVRYGFSIEDIKNMMDSNQEIENIEDSVILKLIKLLENENCSQDSIKNIFITNPFYLNRDVEKVERLFKELKKNGIKKLNILFDMNPYLLNLNDTDLNDLIISKRLNRKDFAEFIYCEITHII